jgi:formylmethanofuran dehydrogenase subunit E
MAAMTLQNQGGRKVSPEPDGRVKCEACGTMQYEYKPAVRYDGPQAVQVCKPCLPAADGSHLSLRPQR